MKKLNQLITIIIAGGLFSLSYYFPISTIIIKTLSFLILLEVVRAIYEYATNSEHRIKVRYVIDGAILFGVRELFVAWVMLKTDIDKASIMMTLSIAAIGILILYRKAVIETSPSRLEKEYKPTFIKKSREKQENK